ncbi:Mu-like prophage FluMu protein gp29 [Pandoraea captiosa]|uniref:Mu-like prophage FluMu protein gp29 n=1 Tax=Pandoraea captiosa TaxID=2508302 RepID=A0A5E4ZHW7_9BURK|nr:DUF935 domain-containing protein [Pandoraea captiosa]VVE59803.1 Mu-like prophage FluMu protein gp29 [Pandoraea captiosa]
MVQILDANGNPIERAALSEPQTAKLGWITRDFAGHPSRGLTPKRLHAILQQAERGDLEAQADLFLDMEERDAHLFAEMSKRKRALLTLDWRIVPPANASEAEKKQAAQLKEWFDSLPNLDDVLLDCMDAIGHGFSAQEITWERLGKTWFPKAIEHRPQRWFRTPYHDGNDLRLRDSSADGQPLWSFGWLVHKHRAKSGYLTRSGLHRVLVWPYLFKHYAVADLAEFLEIYGLPLRIGTYSTGATKDEKSALLKAVVDVGHNAAGIIPEGMEIDFKTAAQGTNEPFDAMISWAEKSQSKAVLGGTLTSQADGRTSTNALGNTHNEVRHDLLVSDARQVSGTLTGFGYMLLALNGAATDPRRAPRVEFDTREPDDMKLYAESLPKLIGAGFKVPRAWAQEKLMIPEPAEGEEVLTIPKSDMVLPPEERPRQATASTRYVAVLKNDTGELVYADQHALDQTIDQTPVEAVDAAMGKMLAPVIAALRSGTSPDDAMELLLESHADMDEAELAELLGRCVFVADVWGRINGR